MRAGSRTVSDALPTVHAVDGLNLEQNTMTVAMEAGP
jgi:hypothetical protein